MGRASVSETCTGIGALHENYVMGDRAGVLMMILIHGGGSPAKVKKGLDTMGTETQSGGLALTTISLLLLLLVAIILIMISGRSLLTLELSSAN